MKRFVLIVGLLCVSSPALADDEPEKTPEPLPAPVIEVRAPARAEASEALPPAEGPPRYDLVRVNVGARIGYIGGSGFDAFSTNDVLGQFSIDGTYPLLTRGNLVVAAGLGWDFGAPSSHIRSLETHLAAHRFSVPVEARYHFAPWLYGFGKVAPGVAAMFARVETPTELSTSAWAFSADVSVGASVLMGPRAKMEHRTPRFWLTPEVGYGFTTKASLALGRGRADSEVLGSDEDASLRSLALSGVFWRASVGTTF